MDFPNPQYRWKCACALLAGWAAFAVDATEPSAPAAPHYSIRGSLDEAPSSALVAPRLTAATLEVMSVNRDGFTLAAHLVEVPLACAGDEIFANGFD